MKLIIALLAILVMLAIFLSDRDSRGYRLIVKVVSVINPIKVEAPLEVMPIPFESDLKSAIEGWRWFNSDLVDSRFTERGLVVTALEESVWWKNKRATSYFHYVTGDVDIITKVKVRKTTALDEYPDSDYQFGGLMMRDPQSAEKLTTENYIFNTVGYRGDKLQIESKSTKNGYSDVQGYDWASGDAELKISRRGDRFMLYVRAIEKEQWINVDTFVRADLPQTLEVALIVYSFSYGKKRIDITANFEHLSIE